MGTEVIKCQYHNITSSGAVKEKIVHFGVQA